MRTQSTPVTVETEFGILYVAVACADPYSYHDSARGNVTDLRPEVWVATDAGFEADPNAFDHWTIRGRAYAVHYQMVRDRGAWHFNHAPYAGGLRDDRRGQVKFQSKTWEMMREAVLKALDTFHRQHPGWEELSLYMLHKANEDSERGKAEAARREAEKHDGAADGHRALKDKAGARVPGAMMALVK